jgi:hypothetical protein
VAVLNFYLYDLDDNEIEINDVISYEISKDTNIACDSARITFVSDSPLNEIVRVEIFIDGEKIFNGYADTQREYVSADGYECFIYARSSACILVDNEAEPFTYISPSEKSLYINNARDYGFKCKLPKIVCSASYQVSKGTSCFGAINNFVYGMTGKRLRINVNDELVLSDSSSYIDLNQYGVISEKRVINRGDVITAVDYKIDGENNYNHHIKSRFFENKKINTSVKINVSSLPDWQKSYVLMNTLTSADESYNTIEMVIDSIVDLPINSNIEYNSKWFGKLDGYYINSICIMNDVKGERTKVELCKNVDLKEIKYVAK